VSDVFLGEPLEDMLAGPYGADSGVRIAASPNCLQRAPIASRRYMAHSAYPAHRTDLIAAILW
jgi:hypothetical protein